MVEASGEVRVVMRWWSRRLWRLPAAGVRWRLAARGLLKVLVVGGVVVLVPLPTIHRPEQILRERVPVGPAEPFAEKLSALGVVPVAEIRRCAARLSVRS